MKTKKSDKPLLKQTAAHRFMELDERLQWNAAVRMAYYAFKWRMERSRIWKEMLFCIYTSFCCHENSMLYASLMSRTQSEYQSTGNTLFFNIRIRVSYSNVNRLDMSEHVQNLQNLSAVVSAQLVFLYASRTTPLVLD